MDEGRAVAPWTLVARALAERVTPLSRRASEMGALYPEQRRVLRQAWERVQLYGAVALCTPLGSGKTYVAASLGRVAAGQMGVELCVLAPARLLPMWRRVCAELAVPVAAFYSHRRASLGGLPEVAHGRRMWIVDEAHHFRNPNTLRYAALAAASVRGALCLVTATPLNLGLGDVAALLDLCGMRPTDDTEEALAMAWSALSVHGGDADGHVGAPGSLGLGAAPWSLAPRLAQGAGDLAVHGEEISHALAGPALLPPWQRLVEEVAALQWPNVAAREGDGAGESLLRALLWERLRSHPAAFAATLARLHRYYRRCQGPQGALMDRRAFYHLFGRSGPLQLPLAFAWPAGRRDPELSRRVAAVAQRLGELAAQAAALCPTRLAEDEKALAVAAWLEQHQGFRRGRRRVLLFSHYAETAQVVARHLGERWRCAFLSHREARVGRLRVKAGWVLEAFAPETASAGGDGIRLLVGTDLLSAGHNLQGASMLVHLDTPWNPVVLAQRNGRIVRSGQVESRVYIGACRLDGAAPWLDAQALRQAHTLRQRATTIGRLEALRAARGEVYSGLRVVLQPTGRPPLWTALASGAWVPCSPEWARALLSKAEVTEVWRAPLPLTLSPAGVEIMRRLWVRLRKHRYESGYEALKTELLRWSQRLRIQQRAGAKRALDNCLKMEWPEDLRGTLALLQATLRPLILSLGTGEEICWLMDLRLSSGKV